MIKASDAREVWTEQNQLEFDRAERAIDDTIRENGGDDEICVDISGATKNKRVIDSIRRAYDEGGWDVTVAHGDQRDPECPSSCA